MPTLGILSLTGPDHRALLQGLCTCDVSSLTETGPPIPGACCDIKGRVIANFRVYADANALYLILPYTMLDITQRHLQKYAVFSNVSITIGPAPETWQPSDPDAWMLECIEAKWAYIYPETSGLFTPQMIDWEKIGGVSFNKGCYLGQEIVARTQYLGKSKKHLHRILFKTSHPLTNPAPGTPVKQEHTVVGTLINSIYCPSEGYYHGLAVLDDTQTHDVDYYLCG